MPSADTIEFLTNWNKKLELITGDGLEDVYEKFSTLYKIYGRLCNDATSELTQKGIIGKGDNGDQKSATENVVKYLSADVIIQGFHNNNIEGDIEALINVMPHFHIKFTNQKWDPLVDNRLLNDLRSTNNTVKALAILQMVYFVRCNYEHSRKDFQEYQRILVEPINNLIATLNSLLTTGLS
jgi:hypothetical protein